jgi:hypothetical protein
MEVFLIKTILGFFGTNQVAATAGVDILREQGRTLKTTWYYFVQVPGAPLRLKKGEVSIRLI